MLKKFVFKKISTIKIPKSSKLHRYVNKVRNLYHARYKYHSSTMQLTSPISSENLMQSRLGELGLQSVDAGVADDCFFRSVSHQLYGNSNHQMRIHTAGVQCMRENPERFIESNTENSWLRYLNNMCTQGTWADALIIQAVADALKVTIQVVESNQGFAPLTTVYPVQERNTLSTITIGHIDEYQLNYISLCINHCLTIKCLHFNVQ